VKERYTIDASVWVAALLPTDTHHQSSRDVLVHLMAQNAPIICPTLILPEVAAAVARNTDRDDLAIQGSESVRDFPGMTLRPLEHDLAMKAARLAAIHRLVDQMRRSSRGVCGNIVEGFAKRRYEKVFKNALNDSLGESEETKLWLDFALDCDYMQDEEHKRLTVGYGQVSAMLWTLMTKWETFG